MRRKHILRWLIKADVLAELFLVHLHICCLTDKLAVLVRCRCRYVTLLSNDSSLVKVLSATVLGSNLNPYIPFKKSVKCFFQKFKNGECFLLLLNANNKIYIQTFFG